MSHNLGTTEVIDDPMSNEDIVNQDNISDEDIEMMTNNYEISGSRPISVSYTHLTLPTNREV